MHLTPDSPITQTLSSEHQGQMRDMSKVLHIVGGGMAGSEAAWQAAQMGVQVRLYEMRPKVGTFAHQTGDLGEMVCSNSFRSDDHEQNAVEIGRAHV